jgi:hypothetical protein
MEAIDAVEMVRKIRDAQFDQTKGMSKSEYLNYVKEAGGRAIEEFRKMAHDRAVAA